MDAHAATTVLGGIATIIIVGLVVSNAGGVAQILNGLANLYGTAARSSTGH